MADKGWTVQTAAAAGIAAGTGAAQLGLGYGLGVVVWPTTMTADDSGWLGSLGWATWIAASSTVLGAVIAARLRTPDPAPAPPSDDEFDDSAPMPVQAPAPRPAGPWRLALALAAAVGALVTVALIALPARAAVRPDTYAPETIATGYALVGVVLGLVIAYWAVWSRPVAANLIATTVWLWALAVAAIVVQLSTDRASETYLTSWQFAELSETARYGTIYWPSALLTVLAALLIGMIAVWPAVVRGDFGLGAATSGAVGPLLVAVAFLALAPRLTGSLGPLESAYLIAPYAVLAGLAGSALTVTLGRQAAERRERRARRAAAARVRATQPARRRPAGASATTGGSSTAAVSAGSEAPTGDVTPLRPLSRPTRRRNDRQHDSVLRDQPAREQSRDDPGTTDSEPDDSEPDAPRDGAGRAHRRDDSGRARSAGNTGPLARQRRSAAVAAAGAGPDSATGTRPPLVPLPAEEEPKAPRRSWFRRRSPADGPATTEPAEPGGTGAAPDPASTGTAAAADPATAASGTATDAAAATAPAPADVAAATEPDAADGTTATEPGFADSTTATEPTGTGEATGEPAEGSSDLVTPSAAVPSPPAEATRPGGPAFGVESSLPTRSTEPVPIQPFPQAPPPTQPAPTAPAPISPPLGGPRPAAGLTRRTGDGAATSRDRAGVSAASTTSRPTIRSTVTPPPADPPVARINEGVAPRSVPPPAPAGKTWSTDPEAADPSAPAETGTTQTAPAKTPPAKAAPRKAAARKATAPARKATPASPADDETTKGTPADATSTAPADATGTAPADATGTAPADATGTAPAGATRPSPLWVDDADEVTPPAPARKRRFGRRSDDNDK